MARLNMRITAASSFVVWWSVCITSAAEPIRLHPDNPHYFLFRDKPAVLVGSTEHYGAVLNLDFDFVPYLDELKSHGLNLTRTFTGAYCEASGNFKIKNNTLAPAEGKLICPWARSDQPGYASGGNKFDLDRWDEAYFDGLKTFLREAGRREIVVELVLFCPFYEEPMWQLSPLNAANNINGVGKAARTDVYALKDDRLTAVQDALTRKLVSELNEFDNLYFEICNEPYFGGVTLDWQAHIAAALQEAQGDLPVKYLIAQNISNGSQKIERPNPAVSVFNFHYSAPPDSVGLNYDLGKAIGDDETGFRGSADAVYRGEGWGFLLAGGAVYDNLDYSFTTEHEDGTARPDAPGGGGAALRRQLGILKRFLDGFHFVRMKPDRSVVAGGFPERATVQVLAEPGVAYALYLRGSSSAELRLNLPQGKYTAEWLNPRSGQIEAKAELESSGKPVSLRSPDDQEDIALAIRHVPPS